MQGTGMALSDADWFTIKINVCQFQGIKAFKLGGSLQPFWTKHCVGS